MPSVFSKGFSPSATPHFGHPGGLGTQVGMRPEQFSVATTSTLGVLSLGRGAWGGISGFSSLSFLGEDLLP